MSYLLRPLLPGITGAAVGIKFQPLPLVLMFWIRLGETYQLGNNISADGTCLTILANSIVIGCMGYAINMVKLMMARVLAMLVDMTTLLLMIVLSNNR